MVASSGTCPFSSGVCEMEKKMSCSMLTHRFLHSGMAHNGCGGSRRHPRPGWLMLQVGQILDPLAQLSWGRNVSSDEFMQAFRKNQHGVFVVLLDFRQVGQPPPSDQLTREATEVAWRVQGSVQTVRWPC